MKKILYIITFSLLFFVACEYEIDYNTDLPKDKLVIAAILEEDSQVHFRVYHSAKPGIYTGNYYEDIANKSLQKQKQINNTMLKDAFVNIFDNKTNISYTASYEKTKGYTFDYTPKANDDITIRISHADYPPIESHLQFSLTEPQIDSFRCTLQKGENGYQIIVYMEIQDNGKENYYMINNNYYDDKNISFIDNHNPDIMYESHAGVYYENKTSYFESDDRNNEYHVFSNKKFAGEKYVLCVAYNLTLYSKPNNNSIKGFFEVASIDKNTYDYLYSLGNYINSNGININPVTIKNAWKDAYGFIGIKKSVHFSFK
ncbi:MAG: hypothetical protein ACTTJH_03815 [Bacteroidales bacterium]